MELVQDLHLTASLALILSFLVAKLVAMEVAGRESEAEFGEGGDAGGEEVGAEEAGIAHQDFAGHKGTIRSGDMQVDFDLGNCERFLDVTFTRDNNIATGKMYQSVLEKEQRGNYLGKIVQVVPHITDAIKTWIKSVSVIPVDGKKALQMFAL